MCILIHRNVEGVQVIGPRLIAGLVKHAVHGRPVTRPQRAIWPRTDLLVLSNLVASQDRSIQCLRCNTFLDPINHYGKVCLGKWTIRLQRIWAAVLGAWNKEQLVPVGHGCGTFGDVLVWVHDLAHGLEVANGCCRWYAEV